MSSSEPADRGDWFRALGVVVTIPLVVVASVLIGQVSASPGTTGGGHQSPAAERFFALSPPTTTSPPVTATTTPAPTTTTVPRPTTPTAAPAITAAPTTTVPVATSAPAEPSGYGCGAALAYLAAHAAPGFTFECPGYADGNEAMTCVNHAPECAGEHLIVIADPCPAAYMNEAFNSNSWSDATDSFTQGIDPYGSC
jgi:hypothetical protein